ncbi:hypothetical protein KP509_28G018100 [Ceratopteris richardii]|uniref:Uncharacterized protein n=1 Tax=Ceratopteris richardii TaxID=49495 RepID=A0A8T2RA43_CERRI|nr:hypothetical protein KP509_28G018100 [Ceratopteris richardii]
MAYVNGRKPLIFASPISWHSTYLYWLLIRYFFVLVSWFFMHGNVSNHALFSSLYMVEQSCHVTLRTPHRRQPSPFSDPALLMAVFINDRMMMASPYIIAMPRCCCCIDVRRMHFGYGAARVTQIPHVPFSFLL